MSLASHDPRRLLPPALEARLIGWLIRAGGVTLLVAVAAAWASLLTWSQSDPSLTHAAQGAARNALGAPGALFSDVLLNTLGFASVFLLLAPMFWGLELMLAERLSTNRKKTSLFPLAVLLLAGGFAALPIAASWPFGHSFGGIVGDWLYKFTATVLDIVGGHSLMPLAGLGYFFAGSAMLGYSIGLEREDINRLIERSRRISRSRGSLVPAFLNRIAGVRTVSVDAAPAGAMAFDPPAPVFAPASGPVGMRREPSLPGPAVLHRPAPPAPATHNRASAGGLLDKLGDDDHQDDDDGMDLADTAFEDAAAAGAIARRFAPANAARNVEQVPIIEMPAKQPARPTRSPLKRAAAAVVATAYKPPSLNLLRRPASKAGPSFTQAVLRGTARLLEEVLADFSIKGEVREIRPGPVVTLYELEPARGTKSSRVVALAEDIARSLSVTSARAAIVPGRNVIGIELPNVRRETVYLRDIFEAPAFSTSEAVLPMALGKSIGGEPIVVDLARMPHLLVAGTTGSGKSVGVNSMILSLLFRRSPEECRLLMIDPKMLELSVYNGIPHLLTPVVTDPQKAVSALNWVVAEMEERYKRMAALSVRNIEAFNARVRKAQTRGEQLTRTVQTGFDEVTGEAEYEQQEMPAETMPYIVVVVDEFADLMIVAGKEIEANVQRLAQMARAAGIHLIMATQRPSVDIVTGTIKANFPARISFKVASKIDSRTILNEQGAEQLLGQGDMLYSLGMGQVVRAHGPFVSDEEVEAVASSLRQQGTPRYVDGVTDTPATGSAQTGDKSATSADDLYDMAVAIVLRDRKASTSYLQRRLSIGYNRAADLIERMESEGVISAANATGRREIMVTARDGGGARASA
jgi:S-DNA-T family DNA segregation ATPase FtsK/SpoIIIE